jgi:hypothetical protein
MNRGDGKARTEHRTSLHRASGWQASNIEHRRTELPLLNREGGKAQRAVETSQLRVFPVKNPLLLSGLPNSFLNLEIRKAGKEETRNGTGKAGRCEGSALRCFAPSLLSFFYRPVAICEAVKSVDQFAACMAPEKAGVTCGRRWFRRPRSCSRCRRRAGGRQGARS